MEYKTYHFKKNKNDFFKGAVTLETNTSHKFKYLIDVTYVYKIEAYGYAWNDFTDAENSLITLWCSTMKKKKSFPIIESSFYITTMY